MLQIFRKAVHVVALLGVLENHTVEDFLESLNLAVQSFQSFQRGVWKCLESHNIGYIVSKR